MSSNTNSQQSAGSTGSGNTTSTLRRASHVKDPKEPKLRNGAQRSVTVVNPELSHKKSQE
ncbi:hypothetical protein LPJ72_006125, partial [Coemansia sp. Benny D160-2]